jgi:hypothetical protein
LTVIPTWVQQQLADLAQLLREDSSRVREHFRRFNLDFTFSPFADEGRPFLRVAVNSEVVPLSGLGQHFPSAASGDLHPRSSGSSTWMFTVDLPPNHPGPGWWKRAGLSTPPKVAAKRAWRAQGKTGTDGR